MRRRVSLIRAECEVIEYNPQTYFLISGYNRPIGVKYVAKELVEEKNMIQVEELFASVYTNPLSHILINAIHNSVKDSRTDPVFVKNVLNKQWDRYWEARWEREKKYTLDNGLLMTANRRLNPERETQNYLDLLKQPIMLTIDLANYFDVSELKKVLSSYAGHPKIHTIFYNVSEHSALYKTLKERGI